MRILVVDDEPDIREFVQYNLVKAGYEVACATNGRDALAMAADFRPHLVLMDMMMPEMDGREACRQLRANPATAKAMIVFLSAVCEEDSLVECYEAGADDYITKPFNIVELVERVKAVLRRTKADSNHFEFDDIRIEFDNRRVYKNGEEIPLKPREFDLLEVLVNNRNLALSREKLLHLVWEFDYEGDTRTVDVHIQRLRQKLGISDRIQTVYKTGYRFEI